MTLAIAQRLTALAVGLLAAWYAPPFLLRQRRWRSSVDLGEYESAYRSAKWFGAEPSTWLVVALRVVLIGFALYFVFPEFFAQWL